MSDINEIINRMMAMGKFLAEPIEQIRNTIDPDKAHQPKGTINLSGGKGGTGKTLLSEAAVNYIEREEIYRLMEGYDVRFTKLRGPDANNYSR